MSRTMSLFCVALIATSAGAWAAPPEGKGKPDKGGGDGDPPARIEVGFDWTSRDGTDLFGLSAINGTNYQDVIAGSQVSYFSLLDVSPVANHALVNDYGALKLVRWTFDASGNVTSSDAILIIDTQGSAISCAAFSKDGSKIAYSRYDENLWTVSVSNPTQQPTQAYVLNGDERFGVCDYDLDGTVVAEVVAPTSSPGDNMYRLSRITPGSNDPEQPIVSAGFNEWFRSVDVGPLGSLAYSRVTEQGTDVTYEHGGQTHIINDASAAVYDCDETRLVFKSRHPKNGKTDWKIRDLASGSNSDFSEQNRTDAVEWVCYEEWAIRGAH